MSDGAGPEELALWWKALGALSTACLGGFIFLFGYVQRGKTALWGAVNANARAATDGRLEDARLYATRGDVKELGERLEESIQQSEQRIMDAIRDRPPVRTGRSER